MVAQHDESDGAPDTVDATQEQKPDAPAEPRAASEEPVSAPGTTGLRVAPVAVVCAVLAAALLLMVGWRLSAGSADPPAETRTSERVPSSSSAAPDQAVRTEPRRVPDVARPEPTAAEMRAVEALCERIGNKLGSVSVDECLGQSLRASGHRSVEGAALVYTDVDGDAPSNAPRVLLFGGIHGDEYSSVTIVFKWLTLLAKEPSTSLTWRVLPLLNPDGLLRPRSQRMNANGVDLNRNFPTANWKRDATDYWVRRTGKNPRRYPGPSPLSEPESKYLQFEIESFEPDVIVSIHAPLEVVDFDGPPEPPEQLGSLVLRRLGTYPGSLGRYGGEHLGIPVVTIELPSAGSMPPKAEQERIWRDLGAYIQRTLGTGTAGVAPGATGAS